MLLDFYIDDWLWSIAIIGLVGFFVAWLTDQILGRIAFGILGNLVLVISGAYGGLFALNYFGIRIGTDPMWTIAAAFGGAFFCLVFLFILKRLVT